MIPTITSPADRNADYSLLQMRKGIVSPNKGFEWVWHQIASSTIKLRLVDGSGHRCKQLTSLYLNKILTAAQVINLSRPKRREECLFSNLKEEYLA